MTRQDMYGHGPVPELGNEPVSGNAPEPDECRLWSVLRPHQFLSPRFCFFVSFLFFGGGGGEFSMKVDFLWRSRSLKSKDRFEGPKTNRLYTRFLLGGLHPAAFGRTSLPAAMAYERISPGRMRREHSTFFFGWALRISKMIVQLNWVVYSNQISANGPRVILSFLLTSSKWGFGLLISAALGKN